MFADALMRTYIVFISEAQITCPDTKIESSFVFKIDGRENLPDEIIEILFFRALEATANAYNKIV